MERIDTVVVGGGQAGLAVSHELTRAGRDHVVLERGRVADRWSTERWDSLRLITPRWMSRLPGWSYRGPDPDGYMTAAEVTDYLRRYATSFGAPVRTGTGVRRVDRRLDGFQVLTDAGSLRARHVVVATGATGRLRLPPAATGLHPAIRQVPITRYRRPAALPPGGVLIVGASASGLQVADELRRDGRIVVLSVGRHTRMPRRHRGRDIWWWLERAGWLAETVDEIADVDAARREPRVQLVGQPGRDLDLAGLASRGVLLAGRLGAADGYRLHFHDDLEDSVRRSERRRAALLARIRTVLPRGLDEPFDAVAPSRLRPGLAGSVDARALGLTTVLWATGYHPHHPWLNIPVLDPAGQIRQRQGVTAVPGLYVVGARFQHRRDSVFLDGVRHDARSVVRHLVGKDGAAGVSAPLRGTAS